MAVLRETARRARSRVWIAFVFVGFGAAAQNSANWNQSAPGNWNTAGNWDCVTGGVSGHCVPGAGYVVTVIQGNVTVDTNTTVKFLSGSGGSLTMSGKTLTATDPLGIQMTGGAVTATGSSVINGFLLANDLTLQSATVNGNVQAFNASITGGTAGALTVNNQLTASNSTIGSSSTLALAQPSSISNSTIGGQFILQFGANLAVDNASVINATQTLITQGTLSLQGGSSWTATSQPVAVGVTPGASELDVSGAGTVMKLTNVPLELGQLGDATVVVSNLGRIAATGASGNFLIGLGAVFPTTATMTVKSGGTASANNIKVSSFPNGSVGLLSVTDSGSSVTAAEQLLVASGGSVSVINGSNLTAGSLRIQSGDIHVDSNATLTVSSNSAVLIGSAGSGTLSILGGATASAPGELVLGTSATSTGVANVSGSGSKWDGSANVSVGENGSGTLNVRNSGVLVTGSDTNGLSGSIGTGATGVGVVSVQGGDWRAGGTLQVGGRGSGTLQLASGGTVESGAASIGASAGSTGNVSVSGVGSKWTVSGKLTVGSNGSGSLSILNAGVVMNTNGVIGDKRGSVGAVNVVGVGSSWQNSGILNVGNDGAASLTIDAGSVAAGGASIGSNFEPVAVDVTHHGALTVLGDVTIGGAARTDVTVETGGTLSSGPNATVGGSGGDTVVTITGADSSWTLNGTGDLTIADKGSLFVTAGGTVVSSSITVNTGGLLDGQGGNVFGSIFNAGGTVTSGDATGLLSIDGNYSQTAGTLLFEIDGVDATMFDRILVSGTAEITGGRIVVQFGNGFLPVQGENFDLLSAGHGLVLRVPVSVIGLPRNLSFTDTLSSGGFALGFTPATGGSVPEPGPAGLVAAGAALLLALQRRNAAPRRAPAR